MNEIKAYVRRSQVNQVVASLERAGAPGITLVEVHPVGYGYEPDYFEAQFDDAIKRYRLWQVVKLEVVCADKDTDRLVRTILEAARTGQPGDGMVFVSEVSRAVRVRDGAAGEDFLAGTASPAP